MRAYKIALEFGTDGWWLLENEVSQEIAQFKKFFSAHLIKWLLSLGET